MILHRYFGKVILQYTLLSMLALLGLFTLVLLLDQLSELGKGNYQLLDVLAYVALTIPRNVYELFPMAALLGTMIGLSMLANDSELIAMRAGGVSVLQITWGALKVGSIFVITAMLIGEFVAPPAETMAQRGRAEALRLNIEADTDSGLWMRDGLTYLNAAQVLPNLNLLHIKIFEFDADRKLRQLTSAATGTFENGKWTLRKVEQTSIDPTDNSSTSQHEQTIWHSNITPRTLSVLLVQPDQLSLSQLRVHIRYLERNQQLTARYKLAFWSKIMLPLSTALMVVLAIPFVFVNIRSGTLGRNLFIGIMIGLGFQVANKGFGYIALAYGLPPLFAAILPLLVFLLLAGVMIRRVA